MTTLIALALTFTPIPSDLPPVPVIEVSMSTMAWEHDWDGWLLREISLRQIIASGNGDWPRQGKDGIWRVTCDRSVWQEIIDHYSKQRWLLPDGLVVRWLK